MPEYKTEDLVITVAFKASLTREQTTDADGKKVEGPKYNYKAEITYASVNDAVEKASKFTTWGLQRAARDGDLPKDELITVNGEGKFQKPVTFEEAREKVLTMSDDDQEKLLADLLAQRKAKLDAAKAAKK